MHRLLTGLALVLALGACGTNPSAQPPRVPPTSASPSPSVTADPQRYFRRADSNTVNAAAGPAQAAIRRATARNRSCNRFTDYSAWRRCWHGLLDPVVKGLARTAAAMDRLARHDLPRKCVRLLHAGNHRFDLHRKVMVAHVAAIDGDDYEAQRRAVNDVGRVLARTQKAYAVTFPPLTQACYSPADLASINAPPPASSP